MEADGGRHSLAVAELQFCFCKGCRAMFLKGRKKEKKCELGVFPRRME